MPPLRRPPAEPVPKDLSPSSFLSWFDRMTDADAHVALVTGLYLGRIVLAVIIAAMALPVLPMEGAIAVGMLTLVTLLTAVLALQGDLRYDRLPSQAQLTFGGVLDTIWLVLGYMASGYSGMPFPPLLVLVLGVNGVLLSAVRIFGVATVASVAYMVASAYRPRGHTAVLEADTQAALLVGIGVLSAIVGNRIRAAGWAVQQLNQTVDQMTVHHSDMIASLPMGVVVVGAGHQVETVNRHAAALLGVNPVLAGDASENRALLVLATAAPPVLQALELSLDPAQPTGRVFSGECNAGRHGERAISWVVASTLAPATEAVSGSALVARSGRVDVTHPAPPPPNRRVVTIILRDRTAQRNTDAALRRMEKYGAIAELSAGLAHEVRNPIAALRSAAEQLLNRAFLEPNDRVLMDIIVSRADRLDHIVTDFLEFAREDGSEISVVSLNAVLREAQEDAVAAIPPGRNVTVHVEAPPMQAHTNRAQLSRVLGNLVRNAVQFSPNDDDVYVRAAYDSETGEAVVTVRDHGPGVPSDMRAKIFAPFFTTRDSGSGLGLAVAERAATRLGGRITCDDPPITPIDGGRGAFFVFRFPIQSNAEAPTEVAPLDGGTAGVIAPSTETMAGGLLRPAATPPASR